MKVALVVTATALVLAGCGGHKAAPPNMRPVAVPVYPGATSPKVSANPTFAGTDWTLPAGTLPSRVYAWYEQRLKAKGWKITDSNQTGLRAHKGTRALSIGVRGRTLEVISS